MDPRGRQYAPASDDQQYPPAASYATHMSSNGPMYPPQYASNYAPAYPPGDQRSNPFSGPPPPVRPAGPSGNPPRQMVQGSYSGGISPPLPTSAPAHRGYANSSYGGSAASGGQYAQAVPGAPSPSPSSFLPEPTPPLQGQSPFSLLNPWSMFSSVSNMGQNVQASQEYVSSKVSWFTGGFFLQLFQVDSSYGNGTQKMNVYHAVFKKLVILMLPYLHKYDYVRSVDRVEGNATIMTAPRSDVYAPDLYIPMLAMFTYVILAAGSKFANGLFTPDVVHSMVAWAVVAWGLNFAVLWMVVRLMALQNPPPGVEIFAYSGYIFVNFCISILCGWLLRNGAGWHVAWLYTSTCMSIFLIRTYKYYIRSNVPQPGMQGGHQLDRDNPSNSRRNAHLMLLMGGAQFVLSWLMGTTLRAREKGSLSL